MIFFYNIRRVLLAQPDFTGGSFVGLGLGVTNFFSRSKLRNNVVDPGKIHFWTYCTYFAKYSKKACFSRLSPFFETLTFYLKNFIFALSKMFTLSSSFYCRFTAVFGKSAKPGESSKTGGVLQPSQCIGSTKKKCVHLAMILSCPGKMKKKKIDNIKVV